MMKNDKFNLWQVLLPLLPLLMILASCRKSAEETADNLRIEKLHQLDELLNAQSPQAKMEIEKGMKLAKDSLTFYEYYARKGRWFCQSATPDSTVGYVDRTLRFALRQPDTPRRNGLLAYTYNCQGINYHNFHRKADKVVSLYQSAYAYSNKSAKALPEDLSSSMITTFIHLIILFIFKISQVLLHHEAIGYAYLRQTSCHAAIFCLPVLQREGHLVAIMLVHHCQGLGDDTQSGTLLPLLADIESPAVIQHGNHGIARLLSTYLYPHSGQREAAVRRESQQSCSLQPAPDPQSVSAAILPRQGRLPHGIRESSQGHAEE
jgi:hypothetical protein